MILHKLLLGENAGLYLPFGLSRLRALAAIYGSAGFFQEKFQVDDYYIEVQQAPPFQYVRITQAGELYFEFATSGWPIVRWTGTIPGFGSFESYKGCIVGVSVRASGAGLTTKPVIRGNRRTLDGHDVSIVGRPYQSDLINEPVHYPNPTTGKIAHFPEALYESWAPNSPHTGVMFRGSTLAFGEQRFFSGPMTQYSIRDEGYDIPFQRGVKKQQLTTAYLQAPTDWPRACGVQTVKSEQYGDRQFAIYVDAFDQFSVFPVSAIGPRDGQNQNVDASKVKMVKPTFPGWCYVNTEKVRTRFAGDPAGFNAHGTVDFPELDWKFNHLGTKAATIVYERTPFTNDAGYWASDLGEHPTGTPWDKPFTQEFFDYIANKSGVQSRRDYTIPLDDHAPDRFFVAPGIVEVTIKITIDGPQDDQFTPTLTIRELRRPASATYCTMLVGYVWYDIPVTPATVTPTFIARAGDFVAFDVEKWAPKTGSLIGWFDAAFLVTPSANVVFVQSIKNLNTGVEIASYLGRNPLVAADLTTLSFAKICYPTSGNAGGGLPDSVGISVYIGTKFKENLYTLTEPNSTQKASMLAAATASGRERVNAYVVVDSRWQLIPVVPVEGDGWTALRMRRFREWFARNPTFFAFNASPPEAPISDAPTNPDVYKYSEDPTAEHPSDDPGGPYSAEHQADIDSAIEDTYGRWASYPGRRGEGIHAIFASNPRWGWHLYQDVIADNFNICPETTFYAHPNGTWCLWTNVFINRGYNTVISTGAALAAYDVSKMEHVVFDRVHLEMPRTDGVKKIDTTFFALYNRAVQAGVDTIPTTEHIETVAQENMRATFVKGSTTFTPGDGSSVQFLEIAATWDERTWYLPDPDVVGAFSPGPLIPDRPTGGTTFGATFSQPWFNGSGYTSGVSTPSFAKPHVRFANPLLLGA